MNDKKIFLGEDIDFLELYTLAKSKYKFIVVCLLISLLVSGLLIFLKKDQFEIKGVVELGTFPVHNYGSVMDFPIENVEHVMAVLESHMEDDNDGLKAVMTRLTGKSFEIKIISEFVDESSIKIQKQGEMLHLRHKDFFKKLTSTLLFTKQNNIDTYKKIKRKIHNYNNKENDLVSMSKNNLDEFNKACARITSSLDQKYGLVASQFYSSFFKYPFKSMSAQNELKKSLSQCLLGVEITQYKIRDMELFGLYELFKKRASDTKIIPNMSVTKVMSIKKSILIILMSVFCSFFLSLFFIFLHQRFKEETLD